MNTMQKIGITLAVIVLIYIFLPVSPVRTFVSSIQNSVPVGYLNWIFPMHFIYITTAAWCACIALYYAISWILRTLDIIK